jgi:hypothetical protein
VFAGQLDRALANKKPAGWMTADGSKFLKSAEPATGVADIRKGPGFRMQQRRLPRQAMSVSALPNSCRRDPRVYAMATLGGAE